MADEKCILDPQRDCLGLAKAEMLEKQLERYMTEAHDTHNKMYDRISHLERIDAAREEQYTHICKQLTDLQSSISNLNSSLNELKSKPGKRWDNIVEKVILLVVTALVGFLLIRLGLPA